MDYNLSGRLESEKPHFGIGGLERNLGTKAFGNEAEPMPKDLAELGKKYLELAFQEYSRHTTLKSGEEADKSLKLAQAYLIESLKYSKAYKEIISEEKAGLKGYKSTNSDQKRYAPPKSHSEYNPSQKNQNGREDLGKELLMILGILALIGGAGYIAAIN